MLQFAMLKGGFIRSTYDIHRCVAPMHTHVGVISAALTLKGTRHQQAGDHMMRLQNLTPPQLAGVLGAIMTGENISKPQVWAAYEPTPAVIAAVQALEGEREQLYKAQVQHGIQAPLSMDLRLAGKHCHCHCCCHRHRHCHCQRCHCRCCCRQMSTLGCSFAMLLAVQDC